MCDEYDKFVGVVSLRTLVLAADDTRLGDVMFEDIISVTPDTTEDDVVEDIFKYNIPAMPVVDESGSIIGIVTTDDAWDAVEEDANEKKSPLVIMAIIVGVLAFLAVYTVVLLQVVKNL